MVSTRRSRSMTAAEDGSNDAAAETADASQPEVCSHKYSRVAAKPKRESGQLQPIDEEAAAVSAAAADHANQQEVVEEQQHQAAVQRPRRHQRNYHSQQQQEPEPSSLPTDSTAVATTRHKAAPILFAAPATAAAASENDSEDEYTAQAGSETEDDDWDFNRPDMLHNLAATIRAALGTSRQGRQQQKQGRTTQAATADDDDMDTDSLRWRPQTGLHLPRRVAQVVATAAAAHQQQQGGAAAAGPIIHNPAAAETAAESGAADQEAVAVASTAIATKPKGLAKQLPAADSTDSKNHRKKEGPKTAGKKWYDLPAVEITDEVKRDLRLLRLRGAYDPKRFYKSFDENKFPKHFAIGTVVDDPLDFYGGRLTQGQRKATLTEQLLADQELNRNRKKRYSKLQAEAQKWVKHKKRKTSQPRKRPTHHRPKH